jgi:cell wall-associated NlpC family hydrolase
VPSSRAPVRPAASRSRPGVRPTGGSPALSASEAQALREALAVRQALAARQGGTSPQAGPGRPAARTPGARKPAARKPATRKPATRKPAARKTVTRKPATRRPASRKALREAAALARAARRAEKAAGRPRWSTRLGAVALSTLLLPVLTSLALPGSDTPGSRSHDLTALALTARSSLLHQADRYHRLEQVIAERRAELQRARATERAVAAQVAARQAVVGVSAAELYRAGAADRYPVPSLAGPSAGDVLLRAAATDRAHRSLQAAIGNAAHTSAALAAATEKVGAASSAVDSVAKRADAVLAETRATVADLSPAVAIRLSALGTTLVAGDQQSRNEQAMRRWQTYVHQLAVAGITPPPAAQLADPEHLPSGLSAALGTARKPIPGVAWGVLGSRPITVLPAETVAAVSNALSQLGKPYAAGTAGPKTYDCGGFTSAAWLLAGYAVPATPQSQWAAGAAVPMADLQIGDLVFSPGGHDVGIYLGNGDVLGASAGTYRVGIQNVAAGSSAVRVTLPAPAEPNAALTGVGRTGTCGAAVPAGGNNPAWGGWRNGEIPGGVLCALGVAGHKLRCDAAASYQEMSKAYAHTFGRPLCITDSYRSYAAQVEAFRTKPDLAAVPGTSVHGWGLAVDLCDGINSLGTPQANWMAANAGRFGFVHPDWAAPGGEKPEPWHWEYGYLS